MKCWIRSRCSRSCDALIAEPRSVPPYEPQLSVDLPDDTEAFLALVQPFDRFSIQPPSSPGEMFTLYFEDDHD